MKQLLLADPDPSTPLVLPVLTWERSTGWAADARAVRAGVSASTTREMLFRGTMEGVAISYARIAAQLAECAGSSRRLPVSGRVAKDMPGWLQVLADVLDVTVTPVTMKRSPCGGQR